MQKLSFQDSISLWLDSPRHPVHVAALIILKPPPRAPKNYCRSLAVKYGRLNEIWPIFNKKLKDPDSVRNAAWVEEDNYRPELHVRHYSLPHPGRMEDLMALVSRAHEQPLDRSRPLWETHIIEGLPGDRFALYCKMHHALIDGTAGLKLIKSILHTSPRQRMDFTPVEKQPEKEAVKQGAVEGLGKTARGLLKHLRAVPELSSFLSHMGMDVLRGEEQVIQLPFTAPQTIFNTDVDSSRHVVISELPLNRVRNIAHRMNGSVNDVLLSVYGGALRKYLGDRKALPRKSLVVTVPISLRREDQEGGNHITVVQCPIYTNESDPLKRLKRVLQATKKVKSGLGEISSTASEDLGYLLGMVPLLMLSISGNSGKLAPVTNVLLSNVLGSPETLYLEGAEVEGMYPLSVVLDGLSHNLTVLGYANKLCFSVTACPTLQPGIGQLGELLKASFRELVEAERAARD